jgi:hypothetical protein
VVLVDFIRANADIFAWSPSDMPGIPREVAEHSLDILPHSRAVQQRLRRFDEERRRAIRVELWKLLEAVLTCLDDEEEGSVITLLRISLLSKLSNYTCPET